MVATCCHYQTASAIFHSLSCTHLWVSVIHFHGYSTIWRTALSVSILHWHLPPSYDQPSLTISCNSHQCCYNRNPYLAATPPGGWRCTIPGRLRPLRWLAEGFGELSQHSGETRRCRGYDCCKVGCCCCCGMFDSIYLFEWSRIIIFLCIYT